MRRLYLFWPNAPTAWVDVTATVDRKIDALRCHASQVADPEGLVAADPGVARPRRASRSALAAAEAFRVIVIDDDPDEGPHEAHAGSTRLAGVPAARAGTAVRRAPGGADGRAPRRSRGR